IWLGIFGEQEGFFPKVGRKAGINSPNHRVRSLGEELCWGLIEMIKQRVAGRRRNKERPVLRIGYRRTKTIHDMRRCDSVSPITELDERHRCGGFGGVWNGLAGQTFGLDVRNRRAITARFAKIISEGKKGHFIHL